MDEIRVMIVDDEILAISHLKNLISWKEQGFEIVAESTYPQQAVNLFLKYRPQVVFVDIRMPGMDGLEFINRILQTAFPVKIILLTSYREFEYAKKAFKLGVYDYMLKHELNSEELSVVLGRIRAELEDRGQKEMLIKRQLFHDLIQGLKPTHEQIRFLTEYGNLYGNQFLFVLLGVNVPIPVTEIVPEEPGYGHFSLQDFQSDTGFLCLDVLPLKHNQWGVVLATNKRYSYLRLMNEIVEIARFMQKSFKEQTKQTASVVPSPLFQELTDIQTIYKSCEKTMRYSPFFDTESVILPEAIGSKTQAYAENMKLGLANLASELDQLHAQRVCAIVAEAFDLIIKHFCLEEANRLCRELVALLDSFRSKRNMQILSGRLNDKGSGCCYTFGQMSQWFQQLFQETISEAERMLNNKYSRKVRQTLDIIHHRYHEPFTIESLAEHLGISGDRLRHLFKEETGITVLDYLTQIRMEQAKTLLISERYKIYEIAEMVGYKSSQYFSQVFRKTVGMNPFDYAEGKGKAAHENQN